MKKAFVQRQHHRAILACLDGSESGIDYAVAVARAITGNDNIDDLTVLVPVDVLSYASNFADTRPV
jgi:hypothetical protein